MKQLKHLTVLILVVLFFVTAAQAENPRGATTGPTTAPGYNHPNQYIHLQATQIADNMEPMMLHPEQEKEALKKLASLEKKRKRIPDSMKYIYLHYSNVQILY